MGFLESVENRPLNDTRDTFWQEHLSIVKLCGSLQIKCLISLQTSLMQLIEIYEVPLEVPSVFTKTHFGHCGNAEFDYFGREYW